MTAWLTVQNDLLVASAPLHKSDHDGYGCNGWDEYERVSEVRMIEPG